eukprot:TRINITY_DN7332_c0_g1_i2.p1 TRINITY_DN7332_c0_g1~~TRINITY_DN7332_c0_g1_i2.p1  ORF type:complete len:364 (-),score=75.02 TRINITY_DN7332_c0_g1_i2:605-1696(-)
MSFASTGNNPFDDFNNAGLSRTKSRNPFDFEDDSKTTPLPSTISINTNITLSAPSTSSSTNPFDTGPTLQSKNPFDEIPPTSGGSTSQPIYPSLQISGDSSPENSSLSRTTSSATSSSSNLTTVQHVDSASPSPFSTVRVSDFSLRVVDYEIVGSSTKQPYTLYLVEVTQYGVTQIVKKRFSNFHEFHALLGLKIKPPPKHYVKQSMNEVFIRERMSELQDYLIEIQTQPGILRNPKFIAFFELEELENKRKDSFYVQKQLLQATQDQLLQVTEDRDQILDSLNQLKKLHSQIEQKLKSLELEHSTLLTQHNQVITENLNLKETLMLREDQIDSIIKNLSVLVRENEAKFHEQQSTIILTTKL